MQDKLIAQNIFHWWSWNWRGLHGDSGRSRVVLQWFPVWLSPAQSQQANPSTGAVDSLEALTWKLLIVPLQHFIVAVPSQKKKPTYFLWASIHVAISKFTLVLQQRTTHIPKCLVGHQHRPISFTVQQTSIFKLSWDVSAKNVQCVCTISKTFFWWQKRSSLLASFLGWNIYFIALRDQPQWLWTSCKRPSELVWTQPPPTSEFNMKRVHALVTFVSVSKLTHTTCIYTYILYMLQEFWRML